MSNEQYSHIDNKTLDTNQHIKPLDFGKDGVCGSIDTQGNLIALNIYHAKEGYVGLTTGALFSTADRYDQQAVRRYRNKWATTQGFGPAFNQEIIGSSATLLANAIPEVTLIFADGSKAITTIVPCEHGAVQRWQFFNITPEWRGNLSVQRAAYSQLTEGGPLPDIVPELTLNYSDAKITISDDNLPCTAIIAGFDDTNEQKHQANKHINVQIEQKSCQTVILTYAVAEDKAEALAKTEILNDYKVPVKFAALLEKECAQWQNYLADLPDDIILKRALTYGRMLSIPTPNEGVCIMTDHMLLPLSWNRDAYFVAKALLDWGESHWDIVRKHLIWMFEIADRGDENEWGRCYLINGQVKDKAYQLDQQLFPLLQLAEYVQYSGDQATLTRLLPHVMPLVDTILKRKHPNAYLFPTDETPADDPLDYQYHFSTHLLMWHTFNVLHKLLPDNKFDDIAKEVHDSIQTHFIAPHNGQDLYAYATDMKKNYLFYHDANDVPLALAPQWGFISHTDAVWQATIEFAFSKENDGGYYGDDKLGSIHTPAPWPLGDVQKLVISRYKDDQKQEQRALQNIQMAAQWDGGLPEAYNSETYAVVSRHWFAWPNAFYALAQLNHNK